MLTVSSLLHRFWSTLCLIEDCSSWSPQCKWPSLQVGGNLRVITPKSNIVWCLLSSNTWTWLVLFQKEEKGGIDASMLCSSTGTAGMSLNIVSTPTATTTNHFSLFWGRESDKNIFILQLLSSSIKMPGFPETFALGIKASFDAPSEHLHPSAASLAGQSAMQPPIWPLCRGGASGSRVPQWLQGGQGQLERSRRKHRIPLVFSSQFHEPQNQTPKCNVNNTQWHEYGRNHIAVSNCPSIFYDRADKKEEIANCQTSPS